MTTDTDFAGSRGLLNARDFVNLVTSLELSQQLHQQLTDIITEGLNLGQNPRVIAREMQRHTQDVPKATRARMQTIARTTTMDAYNESNIREYQKHDDIYIGWEWNADLGSRTCRACWSMHGEIFPLDVIGPEGHPNCRCDSIPVPRDESQWPDELTRSLDKAAGWSQLSDEEQRAILGKRGYEQWVSGNYPMQQWAAPRESEVWRKSYQASRMPITIGGIFGTDTAESLWRKVASGEYDIQDLRGLAGDYETRVNELGKQVFGDKWKPATIYDYTGIGGFILTNDDKFSISRDFRNGVVYHDTFILPPELQGAGFATTLTREMIEVYRQAGFKRIETTANIDVGGYTWAQQRFKFDPNKMDIDFFVYDYLPRKAGKFGHQDEYLAWLADNPEPEPYDISQLPYGKEILMGSMWKGYYPLG